MEYIILHDIVCEVSQIFCPQVPSSSSLIFLVGQQFIKSIILIIVESKEKGELFFLVNFTWQYYWLVFIVPKLVLEQIPESLGR